MGGVWCLSVRERWLTGQTVKKKSNLALKLMELSGFIPSKQLFLHQSFSIFTD